MKSTYTITNDNNNIEVNLIALHNLLKESSIQPHSVTTQLLI